MSAHLVFRSKHAPGFTCADFGARQQENLIRILEKEDHRKSCHCGLKISTLIGCGGGFTRTVESSIERHRTSWFFRPCQPRDVLKKRRGQHEGRTINSSLHPATNPPQTTVPTLQPHLSFTSSPLHRWPILSFVRYLSRCCIHPELKLIVNGAHAAQITPDVVTFSRPFSRFLGWFPMGGRSTAIKLSSGDVWVIASTPFDTETKAAVEKLGTVKYILAADADHHFFLCEWTPPSLVVHTSFDPHD